MSNKAVISDRFTSRIYSEGLGFTSYQFYIDRYTGEVWIKTLDSSLELKILDRDETGYSVNPIALKSFPVHIIHKAEKWIRKSTLNLHLPHDLYDRLISFCDRKDPHKYKVKNNGKLERVKQVKNRDVIDLRDKIHHQTKRSVKENHKPNYDPIKSKYNKPLKGTVRSHPSPIARVTKRSVKGSGEGYTVDDRQLMPMIYPEIS